MSERHLVIVGGGVAGLSAGIYALSSGYRVTIIEHNLALGGVCTAWPRGQYVIDGCIHWLTGGPFMPLYQEVGAIPPVTVRPLSTFVTYRDAGAQVEVAVTRDLDALVEDLAALAPADHDELHALRDAAGEMVKLLPPIDAPELRSLRERLLSLWELRSELPLMLRYRKTVGRWAEESLTSARLRRFFTTLMADSIPMAFLLIVLGYLREGWLSRPVGGTAAFRDALVRRYRALGGQAVLHATVDEVLVEGGRARGVRLADGSLVDADLVLSTASEPETVLRLLGGRFDADATRKRLERWKIFDPIVLASFGVARPYEDSPSLLLLDGIDPVRVGGRDNRHLYVRVENDDPCFAPPGHTVVQTMVQTDYGWWATRGSSYNQEKDAIGRTLLAALEPHFAGIGGAVEVVDVATPLTYWNMARSWRGAYEGYMPSLDGMMRHPRKTLAGLSGFFMAGQWMEPGGGVPSAVLSGRQAVQLICDADGRPFVAEAPAPAEAPAAPGRLPSGSEDELDQRQPHHA